jgi:hypothetical protein
MVQGDPVAVIVVSTNAEQGRIHVRATRTQSSRQEERSYTEIVDAMRSVHRFQRVSPTALATACLQLPDYECR